MSHHLSHVSTFNNIPVNMQVHDALSWNKNMLVRCMLKFLCTNKLLICLKLRHLGENYTSPTFASTSSNITETTESLLLLNLVLWRESDVMPRLCSPRRDNGRITLSCVSGDSGTPRVHRLIALRVRKANCVFATLGLFRGVAFSLFPGSSFFVTNLPILGFGLLSTVVDRGISLFWWSTFFKRPVVTIYVGKEDHTWNWWFRTSFLCSMSLCSSYTEVSYHMQRLPRRRKGDHPSTLSK